PPPSRHSPARGWPRRRGRGRDDGARSLLSRLLDAILEPCDPLCEQRIDQLPLPVYLLQMAHLCKLLTRLLSCALGEVETSQRATTEECLVAQCQRRHHGLLVAAESVPCRLQGFAMLAKCRVKRIHPDLRRGLLAARRPLPEVVREQHRPLWMTLR